MSWWSRVANLWRGEQVNRDIDEELRSHIAEALAEGRDPEEARRAFGSPLRHREASRDFRLIPWIDSVRADVIFGWRQIRKRKITSAAAILSLALAMGAGIASFRLIDALLLRPLPVADPGHLYLFAVQGFDPGGNFRVSESCEYPLFRELRAAAKPQAELIAVSWVQRAELTYASDLEMERAYRQCVSGWMFPAFGLKPALGRLLTERDDLVPDGHPFAVLSFDYWTRRFGQDNGVLGRSFRMDQHLYQIVGVAPRGFTGTEPGSMTDIFIPTMMNRGVVEADWSWIRPYVQIKPGFSSASVRDRMQAVFDPIQQARARNFTSWPKARLDNFLRQRVLVEPAASGVSDMGKEYRRSLAVLAVLVSLVILITCANLANLLTAQATSRFREMALRVSIGAGRGRLLQLALVESALLALLAAPAGALFASWAAPFVVNRINPPDNPARLALSFDWRVLGFAVAMAGCVTILFGLVPALRASALKPAGALKGADNPHSRRRLMHALIALQVAFCFVVLFVAGLLAATLDRLSHQPTGFSADRLLTLDTVALNAKPALWKQVAGHLSSLPGVANVALAAWPLMAANGSYGFVNAKGQPAGNVLAYFLPVSPGWMETMKVPLIDGRDFREEETVKSGVALVNEAFASEYFQGRNPVGEWFEKSGGGRFQIVGLVRNARYRSLREPMTATAYVPLMPAGDESLKGATFLVRTSTANPLALAAMLRREVPRARSEFRVTNIRTQRELNESQTVRERLLAMLALFFAGIALLLAGVGLYGVLDYSVVQRRREIAIRVAIGAQAGDVARRVTAQAWLMVLTGAAVGGGLGWLSVRYIRTLLYEVKPLGAGVMMLPALVIFSVALLAAIPPVVRAVRTDPAAILRVE